MPQVPKEENGLLQNIFLCFVPVSEINKNWAGVFWGDFYHMGGAFKWLYFFWFLVVELKFYIGGGGVIEKVTPFVCVWVLWVVKGIRELSLIIPKVVYYKFICIVYLGLGCRQS